MSRHRGRIAPATAVLATAAWSRRRGVGPAEAWLFRSVNRRSNAWSTPAWVVMQAGSLPAVWVSGAAAALRGDRSGAVRVCLTGTSVWAAVKLVKPAVGRGRPATLLPSVVVRGRPQRGLGFPSGHAAVATTLALLAPRARPRAATRALAVGGLVGATRIYVGAHLPLDVVGGVGLGALAAALRPTTRSTGVRRPPRLFAPQ